MVSAETEAQRLFLGNEGKAVNDDYRRMVMDDLKIENDSVR